MAWRRVLALSLVLSGCGVGQPPGAGEAAPAAGDEQPPLVTALGAFEIGIEQLAAARAGDTINLDLGAGGVVVARTLSVDRLEGGRFSWRAQTIAEGAPEGEAIFIVDGGAITGTVRTPQGALYRIRPSEQGNMLERVDAANMPPD